MRLFCLATALTLSVHAADFDHAPLDAILKARVNAIGEVDYASLKADRAGLDGYVRRLAESSPENRKDLFASREHELAYWMNAYNALMLKVVIDAYPIASVRKLGGPLGYGVFLRKEHTLGGRQMSLRSLENDVVRKRYGDPRIHFAIVCASMSCPFLAREAFTAARLDAQLDRLTRESLAQRRMVVIDAAKKQLTLSKLFDWYESDFGDVAGFIKKYSSEENRRKIESIAAPRIRHHDYDWAINDPGSRAKAASEYEREPSRKGS